MTGQGYFFLVAIERTAVIKRANGKNPARTTGPLCVHYFFSNPQTFFDEDHD
jgi:glycerol uptake facilitator-like aquaporin